MRYSSRGNRSSWSPVWIGILASTSFLANTPPGRALADCVDYRDAAPPRIELPITGNNYEIAISGSLAVMAAGYGGLYIADISNPDAPTIVGHVGSPIVQAICVTVSGSHAYISDLNGAPSGSRKFSVIDISNPSLPVVVGSTSSTDPREIAISGNYAYVADPNGLQVINVSNPALPQTVTTVPIPEFPCGWVALSGTHLYVTGEKYSSPTAGGLRILDIANPASPVIVGGITSSTDHWRDITVAGNYAYVSGSFGLVTVDVSTPASPQVVAGVSSPASWLVTLSGSFLYLKTYPGVPASLQVFDLRNPSAPAPIAGFSLLQGASALAASSSKLYLGSGMYLWTYPLFCPGPCLPHLSDPNGGEAFVTGMAVMVNWENSPLSRCVVGSAQLYYSPNGGVAWNLVANNLTETHYVWTVPQVPTQNGQLRVVVLNQYEEVIGDDASDGTFVIMSSTGVENTVPTVHRLYQNSPNPFLEKTQVTFDLPVSGKVNLEVFDLAGRRVLTLANDSFPAGRHEVSWGGQDSAGRVVAPGIYFLHMKAGSFTDTKRIYRR